MRHSIFSVILLGIFFGAMFFFVPGLVIGIIIFMVIIRLLHFAFMGHRYFGHGFYGHGNYGYGRSCDCGYGYGHGYESECDCGCGHENFQDSDFHHEHHHGHGPMQGHMFHWADKVRNMSEEDYTEFRSKMDKGFGYGHWGKNNEGYHHCNCGEKSEMKSDGDSTEKKEETIK